LLDFPLEAGRSHVADFLVPDAILESAGTLRRNFRIRLPLAEKEWNRKIPHAIALPLEGGGRPPKLRFGGRVGVTALRQAQC
jgi:hypothetical protein